MSKYLDKYLKYKRKYKQLQMIGGTVNSAKHSYYGLKVDVLEINETEIKNNEIIKKFLKGISKSDKKKIPDVEIPEHITTQNVYDFIIDHANENTVFSCDETISSTSCPFNIIFDTNSKILHYFFIRNEKKLITLYLVNEDHTWSYIEITND